MAGAVVAIAALAVTVLAVAASAASAAPKRTPLFVTVLTPPAPVVGSDGRQHLAYELTLENNTGARAEVDSVAVRAEGGRTLLRIAGAQLPAVTQNFGFAQTSAFAASEGGRMWLDVTLPRGQRLPRALVHRLSVRAVQPTGEAEAYTFDAASTPVSRRRAVELSPPLRGGLYMNFNGCCVLSPHRSALTALDGAPFLSERFAVDFIQIDAQGAGGAGDLTRNESFFTFGEPVLAVADARVVSTLNSVPENVPLNEPPASSFSERAILGNHVILSLGAGRFAAYGHLQTGSVRVRVGQRVRTGQVLARVGNTGPSGGPHLHFQVSDGPQPLASDGLPFVFRRFSLAGEVSNIGQFLTGAANADIRPAGRAAGRRDELPLHASVVRFAR
ncbi:MAG: M23 family metallopeptidase [Solirubrobacteraceae bacterium]